MKLTILILHEPPITLYLAAGKDICLKTTTQFVHCRDFTIPGKDPKAVKVLEEYADEVGFFHLGGMSILAGTEET